MKMKINWQVLCLKANNNGHTCEIHHVFGSNVVSGSIVEFQEIVIVDDLTDKRRMQLQSFCYAIMERVQEQMECLVVLWGKLGDS
jgi:hypothetical protein